jgi:hypothetical protein
MNNGATGAQRYANLAEAELPSPEALARVIVPPWASMTDCMIYNQGWAKPS